MGGNQVLAALVVAFVLMMLNIVVERVRQCWRSEEDEPFQAFFFDGPRSRDQGDGTFEKSQRVVLPEMAMALVRPEKELWQLGKHRSRDMCHFSARKSPRTCPQLSASSS